MGWGGGWGNHAPQSAKDVAAAFYAGKKRSRSNCRTDGTSYYFVSSEGREVEIARRLKDDDEIAEQTVRAIRGLPYCKPLEFNLRGWPTPTTARHLTALGLNARCIGIKSPRFMINCRFMPDNYVSAGKWFTIKDAASWPTEHPEDKAKRERAEARALNRACRQAAEFVQLTPSLFETCEV